MKHYISLIPLILLIYGSACKQTSSSVQPENTELTEKEIVDQEIAKHQSKWKGITPYSIDFNVRVLSNTEFAIDVTVIPDDGSYILSQNCEGDFLGKFSIVFPENTFITERGALAETPETGTIYEPFSKTHTKAITSKTVCTQNYTINSEEDFSTSGKVQFVIEPKCTMEQHPFELKMENGVLAMMVLDTEDE